MGVGGRGLEGPLLSCQELLVAIRADQQKPPDRCGAGWICQPPSTSTIRVFRGEGWGAVVAGGFAAADHQQLLTGSAASNDAQSSSHAVKPLLLNSQLPLRSLMAH